MPIVPEKSRLGWLKKSRLGKGRLDLSGCLGELLRVDLSSGKYRVERIPEQIRRNFIGGRGLGIKYLYDEVQPGTDPLGPENRLIFATGVLAGTAAQACSRWLVMTKSPLTGGVARACGGGVFGAAMKFAGFDLIILEGRANNPVYLHITPQGINLRDAGELWGKDTERTQELLKAKHGEQVNVACIGPAGEQLVRFATVTHERRTAARCGVGTVMGAKNLKAIVIEALGPVMVQEPARFRNLLKEQVNILKDHQRRQSMTACGTTSIVEVTNTLGVFPVKNFRAGRMAGYEQLTSPAFATMKVKNAGCYSCLTRCGQIHRVPDGIYQGAVSEGPEYETIWAFSGQVGNLDPGLTVEADRLCDLLGLDTISTGVVIGFALELYEQGLLTQEQTGGLNLSWGNQEAIVALIGQIARREGLGRILGEGVRRAAANLGPQTAHYAMHVKGLEFAGYEPRGVKGYALSYATANIGASHMYGRPRHELYGQIDRFTEEDKGHLIAEVQLQQAADETAIICNFGNSGITREMLGQLMAAATGNPQLAEVANLELTGERIITLERAFNVREGFSRLDDTIPDRMQKEQLVGAGPSTGQVVANLDGLLDEYYSFLGYDANGVPTVERLAKLNLDFVQF